MPADNCDADDQLMLQMQSDMRNQINNFRLQLDGKLAELAKNQDVMIQKQDSARRKLDNLEKLLDAKVNGAKYPTLHHEGIRALWHKHFGENQVADPAARTCSGWVVLGLRVCSMPTL
jgi:hypothetical protein